MARLSPSRHAVHRSLRIPDLRAGDDSPLRTSCHRVVPSASRSRRLSTKGLHRCARNGTSRTPSRRCDGGSCSPWSKACRDGHVVPLQSDAQSSTEIYGPVRIDASGAPIWQPRIYKAHLLAFLFLAPTTRTAATAALPPTSACIGRRRSMLHLSLLACGALLFTCL